MYQRLCAAGTGIPTADQWSCRQLICCCMNQVCMIGMCCITLLLCRSSTLYGSPTFEAITTCQPRPCRICCKCQQRCFLAPSRSIAAQQTHFAALYNIHLCVTITSQTDTLAAAGIPCNHTHLPSVHIVLVRYYIHTCIAYALSIPDMLRQHPSSSTVHMKLL